MKIEFWKIADLIPYARNPRKNDAVVESMVSAIKECQGRHAMADVEGNAEWVKEGLPRQGAKEHAARC